MVAKLCFSSNLQLPYLGKFGNRLTPKITPLLTLKCQFIINWKPLIATCLYSAKTKLRHHIKALLSMNLLALDVTSRYIGKTDRCLYTRTKEHSHQKTSEIHQHLSSCEQFQHIKTISELYPDDDTKSNKPWIMAEHVFHNTKIIDKSNHWSLLLYQESLAIQRHKPELNHVNNNSLTYKKYSVVPKIYLYLLHGSEPTIHLKITKTILKFLVLIYCQ